MVALVVGELYCIIFNLLSNPISLALQPASTVVEPAPPVLGSSVTSKITHLTDAIFDCMRPPLIIYVGTTEMIPSKRPEIRYHHSITAIPPAFKMLYPPSSNLTSHSYTLPKPELPRVRALQNQCTHTGYSIIAPTLLARANKRPRCRALNRSCFYL